MTKKYTEDHEWINEEGDVLVMGISAHAAGQLGDVVFVELPGGGRKREGSVRCLCAGFWRGRCY